MQLVLIRGIPGSGKSTMAKKLEAVGYMHCEADQFFCDALGNYFFDRHDIAKAHAWCFEKAKKFIEKKQNCVVSNTFTQMWEMESYINLAKKHGYEIRVICATGNFKNIHGVPDDVVKKMIARFEDFDVKKL